MAPTSRARVRSSSAPGRDPAYAYLALIGVEAAGLSDVTRQIERGLPYRSLEEFQRRAALSVGEVAALIRLPARTLARRRGGRLQPGESDRLVRAARILAEAVGLFDGDEGAARAWLATPQLALAGATPFAAARTDPGARAVEQIIGRLLHGVPV
jgi:putative toxin-antitoxin system antitoxin component (TIGR02293 family)